MELITEADNEDERYNNIISEFVASENENRHTPKKSVKTKNIDTKDYHDPGLIKKNKVISSISSANKSLSPERSASQGPIEVIILYNKI